MEYELYKGKYLIAIYDKDERLVAVATKPSELKKIMNKASFYSGISRKKHKHRPMKHIFLIDCLEKHNDIFAEEDEIFLRQTPIKPPSILEQAKVLGMSKRALYRRKAILRGKDDKTKCRTTKNY